MPVSPGSPQTTIDPLKDISWGGSSNVSLLHISTHAGTHVDGPCHFIPGGRGVDSYSPEILVGKARLFQLPDVRRIDRATLEKLDLAGVTRLIMGTHKPSIAGQAAAGYETIITEDAARYIVEKGIVLLGIDRLSHEEYHKQVKPVHEILLGAGIPLVEGLDLVNVPAGDYEILCLPLKIKDGDGAPARIFLREER
jgi:arylformamidase